MFTPKLSLERAAYSSLDCWRRWSTRLLVRKNKDKKRLEVILKEIKVITSLLSKISEVRSCRESKKAEISERE